MKKSALELFVCCLILAGGVFAAPGWWDNPDGFSSWTQFSTTGTVQNSGGAQAQDVIAKIDVSNIGIESNAKDIWVQIEWEATVDTSKLVTDPVSHTVKWTYDECPASPSNPLTNIDGADFLVHEGTFTPTHEITAGNTYDNGDEFSLSLNEQPECERLEIKFSVEPNDEINYRIEVQTVCWGAVETSGTCCDAGTAPAPGDEDVCVLSFTLDTGVGGDGWWDKVMLCRAEGVDDADIESVEIQTAGGTTIAGPVAWNPGTSYFVYFNTTPYYGQELDVTNQVITDTDQTFNVLVDVSSSADYGDDIGLQIYSDEQLTVLDPARKSTNTYPATCTKTLNMGVNEFQAQSQADGVMLQWQSNSEGQTAGFNVFRSLSLSEAFQIVNPSLIPCSPDASANQTFSFLDTEVCINMEYWYKIEQVQAAGAKEMSEPISITYMSTHAAENKVNPATFALENNYPNPFNPSTTLTYSLADMGPVRLELYDMHGRHVRTLVDQHQGAGRYRVNWDGLNAQNQGVANGVYVVILKAGNQRFSQKVTLLR